MFGFKKNSRTTTIIINGSDIITDGRTVLSSVWQQRHTPSNIGVVLAKTITTSDDPLDVAIKNYIDSHGMSLPSYQPSHRIAFNRHAGISGNVWHHGADYQVTIKGMPERILELCDMSENERESITTQLNALSGSGAIVVAVAAGMLDHEVKDLSSLKKNEKLSFIGFISLQATVSPEARRLIAAARATNIAVYLCTGQHRWATYHLANELGIAPLPGEVFDAHRLDVMNDRDVHDVVATATVFSRCSPEHKKQILAVVKTIDPSVKMISKIEDLQKLLAT